MKEDLRSITRDVVAILVAAAIFAAIGIIKPWRERAFEIALTPVPIWSLLLLLVVILALGIALVRTKQKLHQSKQRLLQLEDEIKVKTVKQQTRDAQQNAEHVARINARRSNWIHGWRNW